MTKPSRTNFNSVSTKTGVAWNCKRCGKTGLASNRGAAGRHFDSHTCESLWVGCGTATTPGATSQASLTPRRRPTRTTQTTGRPYTANRDGGGTSDRRRERAHLGLAL